MDYNLKKRILTEYINTRNLNDFLRILKEQKVDIVIDIRWNILNKSKHGFKNTTEAEIKVAYKRLAKRYHPDLNKICYLFK